MKDIKQVFAIDNSELRKAFSIYRKNTLAKQKESPSLFNKDDWKSLSNSVQRQQFYNYLDDLQDKFEWNLSSDQVFYFFYFLLFLILFAEMKQLNSLKWFQYFMELNKKMQLIKYAVKDLELQIKKRTKGTTEKVFFFSLSNCHNLRKKSIRYLFHIKFGLRIEI